MESTQTSFIQESLLPIITFVGRPTDLKKGLKLYFEAIEELSKLSLLDDFVCWIIGGDAQEVSFVSRQIKLFPNIEKRYKQGKLLIWGRVENDALPELLSRSTVLVMPSYREQFGMVALEAMLCGCPVVGSNVGGLKDLIIQGETGYLFERGNSEALCAILSGILRNKVDRRRMRIKAHTWANHFSQERTFSSLLDVYNKNLKNIPDFWAFRKEAPSLVKLKDIAESILPKKINQIFLLRNGKHISAKCTMGDSVLFLKKIYSLQASSNFIFKINNQIFPVLKSKEEQFKREIYLLGNPLVPSIISYDEKLSLIISQYCSPADNNIINNRLIKSTIKKIRNYKPYLRTDSIICDYYKTLKKFIKNPNAKALCEFDLIASSINHKITDKLSTFNRIHPQVELHRIRLMLTSNAWIMPKYAKDIFLKAILLLMEHVPYDMTLPVMSHGDLKKEHFLQDQSKIVVCDWEHARYCVGPIDEAKFVFNTFYKNPNVKEAIRFMADIIPDIATFKQAVVWFTNQVIIYSIYETTQGNYVSIIKYSEYLDKFISLLNRLWEYKAIIRSH